MKKTDRFQMTNEVQAIYDRAEKLIALCSNAGRNENMGRKFLFVLY